MDNNLLTYMLTMLNMDMTGHCWVGVLASYEFTLEYQKETDNAATDALSRVPNNHNKDTVQLLLEGAVTDTTERGRHLQVRPCKLEHNHLCEESQACALRLAPMHITNWAEAKDKDALVAACQKWIHTRKDVALQ